MKPELMQHYLEATVAAREVRRLAQLHRNYKDQKLWDTAMPRDDQWYFYRGFEQIVESANEAQQGHHGGRFFMALIRTLEILYISDYYRPNAEGLEKFYAQQTFGTNIYHLDLDVLNQTNRLISRPVHHNYQLEPDILLLVLAA